MLKKFEDFYTESVDVLKEAGMSEIIKKLLDDTIPKVTIRRLEFKRQPSEDKKYKNLVCIGKGVEFDLLIDTGADTFNITTNITVKTKAVPTKDEFFKSSYTGKIPKDDEQLEDLLKVRYKKLVLDYKEEIKEFKENYFRALMAFPTK